MVTGCGARAGCGQGAGRVRGGRCGDWRGGARTCTQVGLGGVSRLLGGGPDDPVSDEHDFFFFFFFTE